MSEDQRTETFVVMTGLTPFGEELGLAIPYPVAPALSKIYQALKPLVESGDLVITFEGVEDNRPLHRSVEPPDKYKENLDKDPTLSAEELAYVVNGPGDDDEVH